MYRIKDFYSDIIHIAEADLPSEIACTETNLQVTLLTNKMHDTLAAFTYTLVERGTLILFYNGRQLTLSAGDLYIYSPGFQVSIIGGSDDYRGLCLMADEHTTLEMPTVRNLVRAAYFPMAEWGRPIVHLSEEGWRRLAGRMREVIAYQQSTHHFRIDAVRTLYTLFMLDLADIQEVATPHHSQRATDLFVGFMRRLPEYFLDHRDLNFYASKLCITTTHLSRVVRQISGRTVGDYLDQMLLMESVYLLKATDLSLAVIADRLHFADQSSFTKFFTRLKGVSPKAYRNSAS